MAEGIGFQCFKRLYVMIHINYTLIHIFEYCCIFKFDVNLIKQIYTLIKIKAKTTCEWACWIVVDINNYLS